MFLKNSKKIMTNKMLLFGTSFGRILLFNDSFFSERRPLNIRLIINYLTKQIDFLVVNVAPKPEFIIIHVCRSLG